MRERPIIFGAADVRATLAGLKTQTRPLVKLEPHHAKAARVVPAEGAEAGVFDGLNADGSLCFHSLLCPYSPGDRLWVLHMPRAASRITLEVTGVRVERLQSISEEDAIAEGVETEWTTEAGEHLSCSAREAFASLWDDINGDGSWAANPWVWVVEFRRVTP